MYKIDFNKPIHIHFIGIGGISMSGLAEILLEEGFTVSGSDAKESPLTKKLEEMGPTFFMGRKLPILLMVSTASFILPRSAATMRN